MEAPSGGDAQSATYKDNYIPKFENTTASYKEWRKRIALYGGRMKQRNRSTEVGLNVLSMLTGASWRQCEDLSLDALEKENGLDVILARLDKQWQYDEKVEMPEAYLRSTFSRRIDSRDKRYWCTARSRHKPCGNSENTMFKYRMRSRGGCCSGGRA